MKKLTILSLALAHLITITAQAIPPANHNKASAAVHSVDTAAISTTNVEATKEASDFANRTLWWKWKAGGHGTLNLDCVNSTAR